ncbi:MAG: N-acetyltransferase [Endomicrobiaceae bacterium]|nr:N-acetyltransferase [Endomicrobiaceae bacterium]
MIIRQETKQDFNKVYDLVKESFETARVSNGREQDYVKELKESDKYIPELSLVVEEQQKLIGYIILSKFDIKDSSNPKIKPLLLGPVCVLLGYRNEKIGEKLIRKSFEIAKSLGYNCIFLVGDPNYYYRMGFRQAIEYGIKCEDKIESKYVLAIELVPNTFTKAKGTISFL